MSYGFQGLPALPRQPMLAAKVDMSPPSRRPFARWLLADPDIPGPRTWLEGILVPFYLLVAFSGFQLVFPASSSFGPPPPVWLDVLALGVAALGVVYPSRYLSLTGLCVFWVATGITEWGHGSQGTQAVANWLTLIVIVILDLVFLGFGIFVEHERAKGVRTRAQAKRFEDYTTRTGAFLIDPLAKLRAAPPLTLPGSLGTTTLSGMRTLEVSRHFDSALEASINGGFHQWLKLRGLGASVGIGRFALGISGSRGQGAGTIDLAAQGTIREDIVNDSYTALLAGDGPDFQDVTRLVAPSATAIQDYVRELIWGWQRSLTVNSRAELVVRANLDGLADKLTCETSYVGDRLYSLAKFGSHAPTTVSVVGAPIGDHAILAGAVQFTPDGEWYQIFPIALVNAIVDLMNGQLPTPPPAAPTVPPQGPSRSDQSTPDAIRPVAVAELSSNGATPGGLAIASIGRLSISHGGTELTAVLTQKPVASYIWLYLLARALRNPKDTVGRGALADETFPNLDPKQQRTRLRQRLSDMQATLPSSVAECVMLDGDRVHFDLDACRSDAADLRALATSVAFLRTPMDDAQLREAETLVARVGNGVFLPDWEALDVKVTGGKGGAASVVDDVRTDVDRWRAALLVAVSDAYIARNRAALAVPYLERVIAQHPDTDLATRKLIAAYLESGDTAKAAALDPALAKARR